MIDWLQVLNTFLGIFLVLASGFFAYMSCHIVAEQKLQKRIKLPWEKQ